MKDSKYKFLMISAMYENGGNTTQRFLDGHPELFVYPFESQPGTKYVIDNLSSLFPLKYRWPLFPSNLTPTEIYRSIIDEEGKVRARTPFVSKFRDADFDFSDEERLKFFIDELNKKELTRANIMEAFFVATFRAWKNYNKTGKEKVYVGYSPIIGVDGEKIIQDYNGNGYVLHVVRNPFSAYAETKRRPVPLSLQDYIFNWVTCQYHALYLQEKYPNNFFILRYEDLIVDPKKALSEVLKKVGVSTNESLNSPSWNKKVLEQVYPWGTIKKATPKVNLETAKELSKTEIAEIYVRTQLYLSALKYNAFYKGLVK